MLSVCLFLVRHSNPTFNTLKNSSEFAFLRAIHPALPLGKRK